MVHILKTVGDMPSRIAFLRLYPVDHGRLAHDDVMAHVAAVVCRLAISMGSMLANPCPHDPMVCGVYTVADCLTIPIVSSNCPVLCNTTCTTSSTTTTPAPTTPEEWKGAQYTFRIFDGASQTVTYDASTVKRRYTISVDHLWHHDGNNYNFPVDHGGNCNNGRSLHGWFPQGCDGKGHAFSHDDGVWGAMVAPLLTAGANYASAAAGAHLGDAALSWGIQNDNSGDNGNCKLLYEGTASPTQYPLVQAYIYLADGPIANIPPVLQDALAYIRDNNGAVVATPSSTQCFEKMMSRPTCNITESGVFSSNQTLNPFVDGKLYGAFLGDTNTSASTENDEWGPRAQVGGLAHKFTIEWRFLDIHNVYELLMTPNHKSMSHQPIPPDIAASPDTMCPPVPRTNRKKKARGPALPIVLGTVAVAGVAALAYVFRARICGRARPAGRGSLAMQLM